MSIFVQIPSYRDKQLIPTVVDLVDQSADASAISICICWQHADDEKLEDFTKDGFAHKSSRTDEGRVVYVLSYKGSDIFLIDVDYLQARGCGWARQLCQEYYRGERYSLQIDSHHRFARHWDSTLIEMLSSLRKESNKPVITGYPPAFNPQEPVLSREDSLSKVDFHRFSEPGFVHMHPVTIESNPGRPLRARFLSGGFIFSDASLIEDVPNEASQFFSSEEITRSVRAFLHGYDFFHPHAIVLWHQYIRNDAPKFWDDHTVGRKLDGVIEESAAEKSLRSYERTKKFLRGELCESDPEYSWIPGPGPQGHARSIEDYEVFAGIDFCKEAVTEDALLGREPLPVGQSAGSRTLYCPINKWLHGDFSCLLTGEEREDIRLVTTSAGGDMLERALQRDDLSSSAFGSNVTLYVSLLVQADSLPLRFQLRDASGNALAELTAYG